MRRRKTTGLTPKKRKLINENISKLAFPCAVALDQLLRSGYITDAFIEKDPWSDREVLYLNIEERNKAMIESQLGPIAMSCGGAMSENAWDDILEDTSMMVVVGSFARKPDAEYKNQEAIWYGPGGRRASSATYVTHDGGHLFKVQEWAHRSNWNESEDDMPGNWNVMTWYVDALSPRHALSVFIEKRLNERGADEEWEDELPRV